MPCTQISSIETISDFLVWPTGCQYYFWLIVLGVIFVVATWAIFKNDQKRNRDGDMISAMGVSSIGVTVAGVIGTLIKNSNDIPMIQPDILLIMIAVTSVVVGVWVWKD
jgi:preprotein translocase subunit YajC